MANKKLGTVASELRLPAKKAKGEKKPKWQAKTGGKKAKEVEVAEPAEGIVETPAPEVEQQLEVTTPSETPTNEITTEPVPTVEPLEASPADEITPAPTPTSHQQSPRNSRSKPTSSPRSSA